MFLLLEVEPVLRAMLVFFAYFILLATLTLKNIEKLKAVSSFTCSAHFIPYPRLQE